MPAGRAAGNQHIRPPTNLQWIWQLALILVSAHAAAAAAAAAVGSTAAQQPPSQPLAAAAAAAPARGFPKGPVYSNPWVQQHVALAYAPETTRDGLGAQAFRMLGIYALARALGLKYLHTAPECIDHIGGLPHYQGQNCSSRMVASDHKQLERIQRVLSLPSSTGVSVQALNNSSSSSSSSSSSGGGSTWDVARLDDTALTWDALRGAVHSALQRRRPTVIKLARVQALLCQHPDVFLALPQLRPPAGKQQVPPHSKPWLLRSVRVAVHMRRGDITQNVHHLNRLLPLRYYVNVLQQLTKELEGLGHDVVIECFTERPTSPAGRRELVTLRSTFPSLSLMLDSDDLWSWQTMARADVLVLSLSTYGLLPALLNPSALVISPQPVSLDGSPMSVLRMRHWHSTADHSGTLQPGVLQQVRQRFGALHRRPQKQKQQQKVAVGVKAAAAAAAAAAAGGGQAVVVT